MGTVVLPYRASNPQDFNTRSISGVLGDLDAICTQINGLLDSANFANQAVKPYNLVSPTDKIKYRLPLAELGTWSIRAPGVSETGVESIGPNSLFWWDPADYPISNANLYLGLRATLMGEIAFGPYTAKLRKVLRANSTGAPDLRTDTTLEYCSVTVPSITGPTTVVGPLIPASSVPPTAYTISEAISVPNPENLYFMIYTQLFLYIEAV